MVDERLERARSFGTVADVYDRHRPGYPAPLYHDVLALTVGRRVLDAGAGTGRASIELARRGAHVRAVEPDPAMAALLRRNTRGMTVEVEQAPFEDTRAAAGSLDLVVAAQAWQWIDQSAGPATAARILAPGGAVAVWWNGPAGFDGPVWDAIHAAYTAHAPDLGRWETLTVPTEPDQALAPIPGLGRWRARAYQWFRRYDAAGYCGLLASRSDHLRLDPDARERLLDAVHRAVTGTGRGHVDYRYRTLLMTSQPSPST